METRKYKVEIVYEDGSATTFEVSIKDTEYNAVATMMMITRGTLLTTTGKWGIAYNERGRQVACYFQ